MSIFTSLTRLRTPRVLACIVAGVFALASLAGAQPNPAAEERAFLKSIEGEWIGTCEQSTDGEQAENKYFHAVIKQTGDDTFRGEFDYYRLNGAKNAPIPIGNTRVSITIQPDGTALSEITGEGSMLVNDKPKNQKHRFGETLAMDENGALVGNGEGSISVDGMPFGLGKNGKIRKSETRWSLKDGILAVDMKVKAGFRALIFTRNFDVTASYTAQRGSDIAGLINRQGPDGLQAYAPKSHPVGVGIARGAGPSYSP